jgi:transcriptional regulator with PAS, ATPase and Fis domain
MDRLGVGTCCSRLDRRGAVLAPTIKTMRQETFPTLVGNSAVLAELKDEIARVAQSDAKVLITGESGTGKELVARQIHLLGPRSHRPFVPVNCAGLTETLLESELFGYVKGSFTGAHRDRPGKLETADQGSIFLDEIGEMTPRMQGLLLRFLETGELQKVGSDRIDRVVNVRVIAATNRNLTEMVSRGEFREDLFYRINVIHVMTPPLRSRLEDIPLLVEHFLARFAARARAHNGNGNGGGGTDAGNGARAGVPGPRTITVSPDGMSVFKQYHWPGNVRELENVMERLVVTAKHDMVGISDLPVELRTQLHSPPRAMRERRRTISDELYRRVATEGESFWTAVYPLYMQREITKSNVREIVRRGLQDARGNYKSVARMFNLGDDDYKRFLNFLRKHDCQLPFKEFR